jgi:uncharacterized protein YutE (UPF0331/DUF86 family)
VTVDPALVTRKLLLVAADLDALRPVADRGEVAYLGNPVEQAFVERYLERLIGRMIDMNYHLITGAGQPPPSDYYVSFVRLGGRLARHPALPRAGQRVLEAIANGGMTHRALASPPPWRRRRGRRCRGDRGRHLRFRLA